MTTDTRRGNEANDQNYGRSNENWVWRWRNRSHSLVSAVWIGLVHWLSLLLPLFVTSVGYILPMFIETLFSPTTFEAAGLVSLPTLIHDMGWIFFSSQWPLWY